MTMSSTTSPATPADLIRRHRIGSGLLAAAVAYLLAAGMMGLVFASRPPAQLLDGLADYQQGEALYRWGFVGASLLAPAFVTLLLLMVAAADVPPSSARRSIATVLLAAYVTLATIAYSSQYTFLPRLVGRDAQTAALWYFHDVDSIPYAIDLTGYTLLSLAAILLASLLAERHRRWLAGWLVAMGALSIAAFVLHAAGASTVAGMVSLASAACTVPIVALATVEGRRLRGPRASTEPGHRWRLGNAHDSVSRKP
jgi:MFS family permease